MRKGNKLRALIALLALALALNAFGFASADDEIFSLGELEFEEVAGEYAEEFPADELPEVADAELLAAGDEEGIRVVPGAVIQYDGRYFRVTGSNIVTAAGTNGDFSTKPDYQTTNDSNLVDRFIFPDNTWISGEAGHNGDNGFLRFNSGTTWIWRHTFSPSSTYVMSVWYKLEGDANFSDTYRHVAGAIDIATGNQHYNEIGRGTPKTGGWQQDFCVFNGSGAAAFLYATSTGSGTVSMDDFVIYEVKEIQSAFSIRGHRLEGVDGSGAEVPSGGNANYYMSAPGEYYHIIKYENAMPEEYYVTGVVMLMKDGKLESVYTVNTKAAKGSFSDTGMIPAEGTVDIRFEIPAGEDAGRYSYTAFLTERGNPFKILGSPQSTAVNDPENTGKVLAANPVTVIGTTVSRGLAEETLGKDGE